MGALLAEWLKDDLYTIALSTYEGEDGWANGQKRGVVEPAAVGSVESRLHALVKPYVFLNLRAVKDDPGHPMHVPQSMRISGYGPLRPGRTATTWCPT